MKWNFLLTAAMLVLSETAILAQSNHVYRSMSGDTIFPSAAEAACAGKIVRYTTRYSGVNYQGTLWVKSPSGSGCEGGRSRQLNGYFEERSLDGAQGCSGNLTLQLGTHGNSSAQWNSIRAIPRYSCTGVGSSPNLPLVYVEVRS
ncbi:hypothetical protein C7B65_07230 [Phormidesmis priestleyi ULC007]|uniref:Uncharacterized protein n=1 Tax=Phormidesmis priestleyi ULC007 TaxID=1920490 RepID=A0A2T1DJM9_9CYAN|nr:hypothetical protein [Phormidesmis priestleyi]PSB20682.1 hypothetical protein C7B65_07230 [Phormidesmis priestleyi ULC007]PZO47105.1 MAG: hypothetical protein DCF14_20695 [Phormidesmis priestleyi]